MIASHPMQPLVNFKYFFESGRLYFVLFPDTFIGFINDVWLYANKKKDYNHTQSFYIKSLFTGFEFYNRRIKVKTIL